ncbi:receptor-type tyrosine-protein phosphatase beta-like isoform X4 [Ptychodera flava]|uniref:receptor-type tyrosine-protein phosphatase beta-like isoform X4 n=1 Tax=Ptychodera flava TaxID=63121 RepID=UPI00396A4B83
MTGLDNPVPVKDDDHRKSSKRKRQKHSKPVKLEKYDEYFKSMSADMEFRFSEEYEELRNVGRDQSWEAAELADNRAKNRYTNILPYDRTRVKLSKVDDEDDSDYINANWMPGFNSPREFIAAQGALPGTKDDFWRMIWEYNVRTIVMVTQCQERGRVKCDHYWPFDNEPVYYGDILVNIVDEKVLPEWTVRDFNIQNNALVKQVRHYNFTAWPDHGVPETTQSLLKFVRSVRKHIPNDNTPTVVHCSAGVGRTGTFITLDRLIQHMRDNDYVDIYGIACEMRMHRVYMIQTESQYVFIHNCVHDLLHEKQEDEEDDMPPPPSMDDHIYGNVPHPSNGPPDVAANLENIPKTEL